MKSWYCKINYNLRKQLLLLIIFAQHFIVAILKCSEFTSGSEYPRALNIPLFWICQGSAFALVLNRPGFSIYQDSEYAGVPQGSEYVWILWTTISGKNYGKSCYLDDFLVLPIFPLNNVEKKMSKTCVEQCYGLTTLYRGERGIFKHIFKNSHNILSLIVWNLFKKRKVRCYECCFK